MENDHDLLIRINANVESLLNRLAPVEADVNKLKVENATNSEKIDRSCDEIEKLRSSNSVHNWLNTVALFIGTALGISIK